jgi:hypothetical protein
MKKQLITLALLLITVVAFAQSPTEKNEYPLSNLGPLVGEPVIHGILNVPGTDVRNKYDKGYRRGYNQLEHRRNNQKQIIFSYLPFLLIAGFILFIVLISNNASKTKKQQVKGMEPPNIKKTHDNSSPKPLEEKLVTETVNDDMIGKIERLGKLKEQGLITDEEFQTLKQKILQ